jgi:regulator of replication initiation timing
MVKTTTRPIDLEPLDRLEEKIRLLAAMIGQLRTEQARAAEENQRLTRELETARARLAEAEGVGAEVSTLREERDVIRTRVAEMLEQLDALSL